MANGGRSKLGWDFAMHCERTHGWLRSMLS